MDRIALQEVGRIIADYYVLVSPRAEIFEREIPRFIIFGFT